MTAAQPGVGPFATRPARRLANRAPTAPQQTGSVWALIARLLHDQTIDLTERVAGCLLLPYGQQLSRIAAMTADQRHCTPSDRPAGRPHLAMQVGMQLGWTDKVVRFGASHPKPCCCEKPDVTQLLAQRFHALWRRPELVQNTAGVPAVRHVRTRHRPPALPAPSTVQYLLKQLRQTPRPALDRRHRIRRRDPRPPRR